MDDLWELEQLVLEAEGVPLTAMTTNQIRRMLHNKKQFISASHNALINAEKAGKTHVQVGKEARPLEKHREYLKGHESGLHAIAAEFEKRNAAWRERKHQGLMSRFNDPHESEELEGENMENQESDEQEQINPHVELLKSVFEEKPQQFVDQYNEILKDKVSELVSQYKLELQQSLFGAPEGLELPQEEESTADEPEVTPDESNQDPPEGTEIEEESDKEKAPEVKNREWRAEYAASLKSKDNTRENPKYYGKGGGRYGGTPVKKK